jgi:hypothetical protein
MTVMESNQTAAAAVPLCVLCVGEPDGCPRCQATPGIDPDPDAPVLDGAR